MPQTRRNRKTKKADSQDSECAAMEDVNSDQSQTVQPMKSDKQKSKRTKFEKPKLQVKAGTSRQNEEKQKASAKFIEGEDVVDMNVDGDFLSDDGSENKNENEDSSSEEGDRSDGEIESSSDNEINLNKKNKNTRKRGNES